MPSNKLLLRSNKVILDRFPIVEGIEPLKLFPLRLKLVRFGNELKSSASIQPERFASDKFMPETVPPSLQLIPVHLQMFRTLLIDHELREEDGNKLLFHFTNSSASVLAEDSVLNGNEVVNRSWKGKNLQIFGC